MMAKFRVFVTETVEKEVVVDAHDEGVAMNIIGALWPEDFEVTSKSLRIDNVQEVEDV